MKRKLLIIFVLIAVCYSTVLPQSAGFLESFNTLHETMSIKYAFGEWKGIDWDGLYTEFQPRIASSEISNDSSAYYLAIREYLYRIPDGHVSLINSTSRITPWGTIKEELMHAQCGGSYGFALIGLDDERVVVRYVTECSSADSAGIEFGAEILEINNQPIEDALQNTSVLWSENIPATSEGERLQQYRFIGRAPVGESIRIKFKNRGASETVNATLYAIGDNYLSYNVTTLSTNRDTLPAVSFEILQPEGYGYIQVTSCGSPAMILDIYNEFKNALQSFIDIDVPGIILDLRQNEGGEDNLAAALAGFFYQDTTHYESVSFFNEDGGEFTVLPMQVEHINSITNDLYINPDYPLGTVYIEPPNLLYNGKVIVLTGPRQISSGEGIAMALQKLPQCEVVSLYGSHGSFGIVISDFAVWLDSNMDNPLLVIYPFARSLDVNEVIQVDSNLDMMGGVIPDFRPPLDYEAIDKMFVQNIDYELEYAIDHLSELVAIEDQRETSAPNDFKLFQNYPNPFNPTTTIKFTFPSAEQISIKIFDMLGQEIATLINEEMTAGSHSVLWNGCNTNGNSVGTGVYFYALKVGSTVQTRKMLLVK